MSGSGRKGKKAPPAAKSTINIIETPLAGKELSVINSDSDSDISINSVSVTEVHSNQCPCGKSNPQSLKVDCSTCPVIWHADCLLMSGDLVTDLVIASMVDWQCPYCFIPPGKRPSRVSLDNNIPIESEAVSSDKISNNIQYLATKIQTLSEQIQGMEGNGASIPTPAPHPEVSSKLSCLMSGHENLLAKLDELNVKLRSPSDQVMQSDEAVTPCINTSPQPVNPTNHIEGYTAEFIEDTNAKDIVAFLSTEKFRRKKTWSVAAYGKAYPYPGESNPETLAMPDIIQGVADKINLAHPGSDVNQCVVNKFRMTSESSPEVSDSLAEHGDKEFIIKAKSNIFTVVLEEEMTITFRDLLSEEERTLTPAHRSLYWMSQESQQLWTHRIDPVPIDLGTVDLDIKFKFKVRYSLTFRCVGKQYRNSCIVLGDSNTDHFEFGDARGKFGWLMPGERKETMRIRLIDPVACIGYANIVLHVGINDIRECAPKDKRLPTDPPPRDVPTHVNNLLQKISEIQTLSPRSRIIVSTLLPTKQPGLNSRCGVFNRLLQQHLTNARSPVKLLFFRNFFNPDTNRIHDVYGAYKNTDNVHLGRKGRPILARMIKEGVLRSTVDTRSYSDAFGSQNDGARKFPAPS